MIELWSSVLTTAPAQVIPTTNGEFTDDITIQFPSAKIGQGKAFATDNQDVAVPIRKRYGDIEGIRWLVEIVDYPQAEPFLENLEAAIPQKPVGLHAKRKPVKTNKELLAQVPTLRKPTRTASLGNAIKPDLIATAARKGFAIDYQLFGNTSLTNHRFASDSSTLLLGTVTLAGTTVWEPGSCLKYTNGAKLRVTGPVSWPGAAHRPTVLTSIDDCSVGEVIRTNALTGYYADTALELDGSAAGVDFSINNVRIAHATHGIKIVGRSGHVINHAQIVNCANAITLSNAAVALRNGLLYNVTTAFTGASSTSRCEHITLDAASTLNGNTSTLTLLMTNSLMTAVTTTNGFGGANIVNLSSATGVYETAGAGAHYLARNSPYRNFWFRAI